MRGTPKHTFIVNMIAFGIGHTVMITAAFYFAAVEDWRALKVMLYGLAFWAPFIIVSTFLAMRREWRGEPNNDVWDVSIPGFILVAVVYSIYLLAS